MNSTKPLPLISPSDTAAASGQPSQPPPVRTSAPSFTCTLMRLIQRMASPAAGAGAGDGVGTGVGATGAGATGAGAGAGAGAGVVGAGVAVPGATPRLSVGMRTMKASARSPPRFVVQTKYSPVTSRLPFGRFS